MPVNVIPVLVYDDVAEAAAWLCQTFGFAERRRTGDRQAELAVTDGAVMLTERRAEHDSGSPARVESAPRSRAHGCHSVLVRIADVDGHLERARRRGCADRRASGRPALQRTPIHGRGSRRPPLVVRSATCQIGRG
jgi:uncharacterized glyoxalase superfamily protein PhnB